MYFRALASDSSTVSCGDSYATFIQTLQDESLSGFATLRGVAFTLVPAADAEAAVALTQGFSLYFTTPVVTSNIVTIQANIAEKWQATFQGLYHRARDYTFCVSVLAFNKKWMS